MKIINWGKLKRKLQNIIIKWYPVDGKRYFLSYKEIKYMPTKEDIEICKKYKVNYYLFKIQVCDVYWGSYEKVHTIEVVVSDYFKPKKYWIEVWENAIKNKLSGDI